MSILRLARKPPATIQLDRTVQDALKVMIDRHLGAVSITEGSKLKGILTERDIVKSIAYEGRDPKATPVAEIMTADPKTVDVETNVGDALTIMSVNRIRHLPVVNGEGEIQGIISLRFLMHDQLDDMLSELRSLENYMMADGPGG